MPLELRKILLVSTHYLGHVLTFLIENRYVGHHEITQVKIEFGSGRIIFGRVMTLGLSIN